MTLFCLINLDLISNFFQDLSWVDLFMIIAEKFKSILFAVVENIKSLFCSLEGENDFSNINAAGYEHDEDCCCGDTCCCGH